MEIENENDDEKGRRRKDSSKRHIYLLFLSILIIHTAAISLFTRGFLLTRTELSSSFSSCDDNINESPPSPCSATPPPRRDPTNSTTDRCWTKPAVDRIVIIVLDALRIDFVAPSAFFDDAEVMPWMDKLTVLQKLAATSPSSARLFKAIADPPTTSLQRLKGLTTGGLPTFIDIGNSFGAPAIVEDNLIYQLAKNGKRVLMMGDDTWLQLFPDHFNKSFPYPSFNVKDLDTVDDGCIEHLLPSLCKDDWDVLIAHFLGVDHAGHIFGVDSAPMIQKLEQYNSVLEKVIEVLKKHSGPGDLHENTFLIVMGDHGQTTNGDHGGGTAEEVETSLFGMSLKSAPVSVSSLLDSDSDSCRSNVDGENVCIGSIQQIDFAVTIAALIGIPFPFGSIGRVNPELYALSGGTWDVNLENQNPKSDLEAWMQNYANTLCINCWQVKRYIDLYSVTSVLGFPDEDLQLVSELYTKAQDSWSSSIITARTYNNDISSSILPILKNQIDVYSHFLEKVAELARSKWTEFDLKFMGIGLGVLFLSLVLHFAAIIKVYRLFKPAYPHINNSWTSSRVLIPVLLVGIRANSFLSNSYILKEGKVANFFLATTSIISSQNAIIKGKIAVEEVSFLILNIMLGYSFEAILSKQTVGSTDDNIFSLNNLIINGIDPSILTVIAYEAFPTILMLLLVFLLYKRACSLPGCRTLTTFIFGALLSYLLLAMHWVSESKVIEIPNMVQNIGRTFAPRAIYSIGFGLVLLAILQAFQKSGSTFNHRRILAAALAMMCAWSPTIIMLLGRQGPMVAFISLFGVWCIIRLQKTAPNHVDDVHGRSVVDPTSITQWNLLAVSLFFYSGHWCTFDGLRYGAAFIGFDNFNLFRQGALLALDTFGVSHILPIFGLPLLFLYEHSGKKQASLPLFWSLTQAFLIYGFETAVTTTFTSICVTVQRRHLMVWGLFAPKFVFDAVGLILTDVFIFLASLYYF